MGRTYSRLSIEDFGAHLLRSGDLDPIYIALVRADFAPNYLKRWLVGYWCFYHAGVASYLAEFEGAAYWKEMMRATENVEEAPPGGRWPRGHERRHFRGKNGTNAVNFLQSRYAGPEEMVNWIVSAPTGHQGKKAFKDVSLRAREHVGFGPWIGFKIADMIDRCLGLPVSFDNTAVFMFDDPTEAALKLWKLKAGLPENAKPKDQGGAIEMIVEYLVDFFKSYRAPPFEDRPPNIQEIETILCKWKSHMNGHYPLNNDIVEISTGTAPWSEFSPGARRFLEVFPQPL